VIVPAVHCVLGMQMLVTSSIRHTSIDIRRAGGSRLSNKVKRDLSHGSLGRRTLDMSILSVIIVEEALNDVVRLPRLLR
jgi:hypothetical protein